MQHLESCQCIAFLFAACSHLGHAQAHKDVQLDTYVSVYEIKAIPREPSNAWDYGCSFIFNISGLFVAAYLIPKDAQTFLLSKMLHMDLADQRNNINVHLHHILLYHAAERSPAETRCGSFFNTSPKSPELCVPVDEANHKPLAVSQFLKTKATLTDPWQ